MDAEAEYADILIKMQDRIELILEKYFLIQFRYKPRKHTFEDDSSYENSLT